MYWVLFEGVVEKHSTKLSLVAETQQQADLEPCGLKIVEQLSFVNRLDGTARFQLDDYLICNDKIGAENADSGSSKCHLNGFLSFDTVTRSLESNCHRFTVHRFKKSVAQLVIDLVKTPNDRISNLGVFQTFRSDLHFDFL